MLEKDWYAITRAGSATSPSISPGDRYVMIGDGASGAQTSGAGSVDARVKVYDIDACNENTDADNQPERCALSYGTSSSAAPYRLASHRRKGHGVLLRVRARLSWDEGARDVVAFGPEGIHWSVALEGNRDWTSVVTVADNHIIGTATKVEPSGVSLGGLVFPLEAKTRSSCSTAKTARRYSCARQR